MTQQELETALDAGRLKFRLRNGNLWQVRRNGRTKTWKTRPREFRIPVKIGFRDCTQLSHGDLDNENLVVMDYAEYLP